MEDNIKKILALKYRPKNFSELIGQDIMVKTVTNSIKLDKLPNAYLLTGIRGVGKTTTARLIAKAINCKKNFIEGKPNEYCDCSNCEEINKSKHLDVLEMDAASRTGIDDVRELIESSKYNPTSAKYKIYIIDEVHMLSNQAFNGLLKTLEEPPPHLKFIFATTEVKKIPVTIISRCQRFDLNRVPILTLLENLKKIAKNEKCKITSNGLTLIAKASEGSVRDSLSLLDRVLVSQKIEEKEIDEIFVRKMLGIADRSKILEILNFIFQGDQNKSIISLKNIIDEGADPVNFLNDLLETVYYILQNKSLGDFKEDLSISESETETIKSISKNVEVSTLIIFWQFILKGLEELNIVSNQILSLEMLVIRLIHLKDMPSYEKLVKELNNDDSSDSTENVAKKISGKTNEIKEKYEIKKTPKDQMKSTSQTKLEINSISEKDNEKGNHTEVLSSFADLIIWASKKKEVELKYDLEKNVNLVKFSNGKIDISFNENLSKNFVRNLSEKLLEWSGKRWVITLTKEKGQKTFFENELIKKKQQIENEKSTEVYKKFKSVFPESELIEVKKNN